MDVRRPLLPAIDRVLSGVGVTSGSAAVPDVAEIAAPFAPPSARARSVELLTGREAVRLAAAAPRLARRPRGTGTPVIDIPGWLAPEASGAPLRTYLRGLGHDARGWGKGTNRGDPEADARWLGERVARLADEAGAPVALVGWSLGGVIAREVARERPDTVSRVITYGTPVIGGPSYTIGAGSAGEEECRRITELIERTEADRPLQVPVTVIFSRRDGIVHWRACIDRWTPGVEHVEVSSTHLGLGFDPDVWQVVADRLAPAAGARATGAPVAA